MYLMRFCCVKDSTLEILLTVCSAFKLCLDFTTVAPRCVLTSSCQWVEWISFRGWMISKRLLTELGLNHYQWVSLWRDFIGLVVSCNILLSLESTVTGAELIRMQLADSFNIYYALYCFCPRQAGQLSTTCYDNMHITPMAVALLLI